jgi:hypothetical protein
LKTTQDDGARIHIAATLAQLGRPRAAVSLLPTVLDSIRRDAGQLPANVHFDAYRYLEFLGAEAKSAVPLLLQVMRHDDHERYLQAARALFAIDPQAAAKAGVYDRP